MPSIAKRTAYTVAALMVVGACRNALGPTPFSLGPDLSIVWEESTGQLFSQTVPTRDGQNFFIAGVPGGATDKLARVSALSAATGVPVWQQTIPGGVAPLNLVAAHGLIISSAKGDVNAWQSGTGAVGWTASLPATPDYVWSAVDSSSFYTGRNATVYALSLADGSPVWQQALNGTDYTSGAVEGLAVSGDTIYATVQALPASALTAWYYAINRATGSVLWKLRDSGATKSGMPRSGPSVAGDLLIVGDAAGSTLAINRSSGTVAWRTPTIANGGVAGPPALFGTFVFVATKQGLVAGTTGVPLIMGLDRSTGHIEWEAGADMTAAAVSVAVCNSVVLVGTQHLTILDRGNGKIQGTALPFNAADPTDPLYTGYTVASGVWTDGAHAFFVSANNAYYLTCS